jgi:hypothetical protein
MYRIWREHTKKKDAVASAKRDSGYGLVVACQGWPKILLLLRQIDLPRRFFAGFGSKSPRSSLIRIKFKIDQVYSYRGYIVIANPPSLPTQPVIEQASDRADSKGVSFGDSRLELSDGALFVIQLSRAGAPVVGEIQEKSVDVKSENLSRQEKPPDQESQAESKAGQNGPQPEQAEQAERRTFWERVFRMPPLHKRIERALTEDWKFSEVRPRQVEDLLSEDSEETRAFFLSGSNARQYQRLVKEFGCGFETKDGKVVDDSIETLGEYGPELIQKYSLLMEHRELIKRYFAGVFRDGRVGSQSLLKIGNSQWFSPFSASKFRMSANILHNRFQVPNHVIGPMLTSVGDTYWLRQILFRRSAPQEFQQLLTRIAPSSEDSGNAFAPALQLLVLGAEHKLPFQTLDDFVQRLDLKPKDFAPFSAAVYNLAAYRLASDIKCPTFAQFLRRTLDEFGPEINQESARLFMLSFKEFKDDSEALSSYLSPGYRETKEFLRSIGTPVPATVWNMERIAFLSQTLTPEKRAKITQMVRELAEEVKVADIMFLAEIAGNEEECKLLLDRQALIAAVKDIKIDRIVERSHNDLVKELEREIDSANRNGFYRSVRRLLTIMKEEKRAYTERVDPSKLTNIQLSRLLIFHRSIDMPGFLDTVGWNVSLDLQNERSEGGGYLGYDKDMAMVTMVPGQPGDNRAYRPVNLMRAPASIALFHNHAFKDTFAERYLGFFKRLLPSKHDKNKYAGPSGWVGAKKGDISAAAESEIPSFIITKIGNPQNSDGSKDNKSLLVNFDWVIVDRQSGEALRSDRGVFTIPYYREDQLGKLKWPSKKEMRRREKEKREKCPPGIRQDSALDGSRFD